METKRRKSVSWSEQKVEKGKLSLGIVQLNHSWNQSTNQPTNQQQTRRTWTRQFIKHPETRRFKSWCPRRRRWRSRWRRSKKVKRKIPSRPCEAYYWSLWMLRSRFGRTSSWHSSRPRRLSKIRGGEPLALRQVSLPSRSLMIRMTSFQTTRSVSIKRAKHQQLTTFKSCLFRNRQKLDNKKINQFIK